MNVSFDMNFWAMLIFFANFAIAIGGVLTARTRASAASLEDIRSRVTNLNERQQEALTQYKERNGKTLTELSERLQAVETKQENAIGHEDLAAIHRRVDEMLKTATETMKSVARIEGLLAGKEAHK